MFLHIGGGYHSFVEYCLSLWSGSSEQTRLAGGVAFREPRSLAPFVIQHDVRPLGNGKPETCVPDVLVD